MRILFDRGTPVPLRKILTGHTVETAYELGWQALKNGELLAAAEVEGFDLLLTTDQNLRYQQNPQSRKLAVIFLLSTSWPRIREQADTIRTVLDAAVPGAYHEIQIP